VSFLVTESVIWRIFMRRILVTNAEQRKSLSVIRSLGKAGYEVITISEKSLATGSFSKYVYGSYKIDGYSEDSILELVDITRPDLIFPCDDDAVEIVCKSKLLKKKTICPVPSEEAFDICRDKSRTIEYAQSLNVKVPITISEDQLELLLEKAKKLNSYNFPVVVKPKKSSGSRGLRLCKTKEELLYYLPEVRSEFNGCIIQEFIPLGGDIVDAVFLYKNGKAITSFVDKRLRTYPPDMGACTLGVSIHNQEALEIGRKLLDGLNWNGLAMVEFRVDPRTNELYLMEINPRLWGSIQLPIFAGVDFPRILVEIFLSDTEKEINVDYEDGLAMRWIGDYVSIIRSRLPLSKKIKLLFSTQDKKTTSQIADKNDPLPGIIFFLNGLLSFFNPKWWRENILR